MAAGHIYSVGFQVTALIVWMPSSNDTLLMACKLLGQARGSRLSEERRIDQRSICSLESRPPGRQPWRWERPVVVSFS